MAPTAVEGGSERVEAVGSDAEHRTLIEDHERALVLAALGVVGGRQRSAAALLRMLPGTLRERMRRLGVRAQRAARKLEPPAAPPISASVRWRGSLPPGSLVELRGLNGPVRIEPAAGREVEVLAVRRGPRTLLRALDVKVVRHAGGILACAVCELPAPSARRLQRRVARGLAWVRVEIVARVPPGIRVSATTFNDDVEVIGAPGDVEASVANGRVRFLPRGRPPAGTDGREA